jgi:hypothetical protein
LLIDLLCEFACWRDDQCVKVPLLSTHYLIHYRKQVCSGFARARLRAGDQILVIEDNWNGLLLNGCGGSETHGGKTVHEFLIELKIGECQLLSEFTKITNIVSTAKPLGLSQTRTFFQVASRLRIVSEVVPLPACSLSLKYA